MRIVEHVILVNKAEFAVIRGDALAARRTYRTLCQNAAPGDVVRWDVVTNWRPAGFPRLNGLHYSAFKQSFQPMGFWRFTNRTARRILGTTLECTLASPVEHAIPLGWEEIEA